MPQNHLSTSSFSNHQLKRELIAFLRLFLITVLIPALLFASFILALGWRTGATMSPTQIATMQNANPKLIWAGEGQYYGAMKMAHITVKQPEIIFVGNSRCSQVRSGMFKPYTFYNACLTSWTLAQIRDILERMTIQAHPRVILFNLDYFMFSKEYSDKWAEKSGMDYEWKNRNFLNGLISLGATFKAYPWTMTKQMPFYLLGRKKENVDNYELLGLSAIRAQAGFRYDGSMLYDPITIANSSNNNKDLAHILAQVPLGSGSRMSAKEIEELRSLGQMAKERGVILVGLQLPILKDAVEILDTGKPYNQWAGPDSAIWKEFMSADTKKLFNSFGIHFFDMTHYSASSDRAAFVDPAHPGERALLGAFLNLFDDPEFKTIFPKIDTNYLKNNYETALSKGEGLHVFRSSF